MTGKSKMPEQFTEAFNRIIASHFWSPPDKGFMKAKKEEYFATLGSFPADILNEAIDRAKEESDAMPGTATLFNLCKKIQEQRAGIKTAAEIQEALEENGRKYKGEFCATWEELERHNRWEVSQLREKAIDELRDLELYPTVGKYMDTPEFLIRQRMVKIYRERNNQ